MKRLIVWETSDGTQHRSVSAAKTHAKLLECATLMDEVAVWLSGDESFSYEVLAEQLAQMAMEARSVAR